MRFIYGLVAVLMTGLVLADGARSASTRRPAVRVENGTVINSRAEYHFTTPQGWTLKDSSTYRLVELVHPTSSSTFSVNYDRARGDATAYYMSMVFSLKSPSSGWLTIGSGDVTIDGYSGTEIRGTRARQDGVKVRERILVVLRDEYLYLILSSALLDQAEERKPDIDQMISSFRWGTSKPE